MDREDVLRLRTALNDSAPDAEELRREPHGREKARQPLGRNIITSLWGNCTVKVMVGFLFVRNPRTREG